MNRSRSDTIVSDFDFPERAFQAILGHLDANLKLIESTFGVKLSGREGRISVRGAAAPAAACSRFFEELTEVIRRGYQLRPPDVALACRLAAEDPPSPLLRHFLHGGIRGGSGRREILPRSARQREYIDAVRENELVFSIGPAGTGKTFLAVAMALEALEKREVRRLVLTRPAVEAGERLGFLPGDLVQKVDPYLRPLYDALFTISGGDKVGKMMEQGFVEVAPLAFMRGRTLNDSFVILDEAQNTTPEQMKMFLTRIGEGSQAIVNGDITQIDLPGNRRSGLIHAREVVQGVKGTAFIHFDERDVVRHPLVQRIVRAYDTHEEDASAEPEESGE